MKIAIISDLHSNIEALQACLARAQGQNVEKYICLGDIIGYGPDPAEVLDIVMSLPNVEVVKGNHEEALFTAYYKGLRQHIRQTVDWTKSQLSASQLAYLETLPYQVKVGDVTMVHASADQPKKWPYIYNIELATKCMRASDSLVTFVGHTHQPEIFFETPSKHIKNITPSPGLSVPLYAHCRYVINVGSVGQPRDDINAASFVIYDTVEREVKFHRVAYDYMATGKKIIQCGLPHLFAERLAKGH
ncbi:MAG: metallophosphatase family protein [Gammaproteobacteria bacterium]|nr:metallophosphatase family protein [Gammaproteobacteria bacterium]